MRRNLLVCTLALAFFALAAPGAQAEKPIRQVATEVKALLTEDNINNIFDMFLRLKGYGITWQPALTAPNDLVNRLSPDQLRMYAGVKMFDAVYAATFQQRQAVADAVRTIEAIQDKLDLRSHADLSGRFFQTLKKAAADPASVNVQQLLDQLAADYVKDVPALLADKVSAEFLLNSLYGFTVEFNYISDYFFQNDRSFKLSAASQRQRDRSQWAEVMGKLFQAFGRMGDTINVSGATMQKVSLIQQQLDNWKADTSPVETPAMQAAWRAMGDKYAAVRKAILTPGAR